METTDEAQDNHTNNAILAPQSQEGNTNSSAGFAAGNSLEESSNTNRRICEIYAQGWLTRTTPKTFGKVLVLK